MKICAIIAEYNPFHLGHLKQIEYVKNTLGAEKIIVIMSGNFTQRGEVAVLDKFTRAKHAIIAGADLVIELPTVFSISNAEVFANGAINIINSLGVVDSLCFGVESGTKDDYIALAKELAEESKEFKKRLKEKLETGISLAKAKHETIKELGDKFNEQLLSSPNNILGLEYTKALVKANSDIQIFPMLREGGASHNDTKLKKGITSATSIRETIKIGKLKALKKNMPSFVHEDLESYPFDYETLLMASVITTTEDELKRTMDCTEGLENRIKAFSKDNLSVEALVDKVWTKRYTKTRIQRILLANMLDIRESLVRDALDTSLYAKVLAINSDAKNLIPLICNNSSIPVLTRKSDETLLKKTALKCFEKDVLATHLYSLISHKKLNEHHMLII